MNKHIDEGDANLNGTAAEDRLGATSQQAAPEGIDHEGHQAAQDAPGTGPTDAGDGAVAKPVSGLARLREMFSTPRRERAPRSEKTPTAENIKWAKPMPAPRPSVVCDQCRVSTGTLLRVSDGVYRHKGCRPAPSVLRKGGSR